MSELNQQIALAINKGLISQKLADEINEGRATMDDLDSCMSDVVEYDSLSILWKHCVTLTLDSSRTRLNNLKMCINK